MPGRKKLRKLQFGRETPAGTIAATTTIWRGAGDMPDDQRNLVMIGDEEMVGMLGGTDRSYVDKLLAGLTLAATPATFEQLPYLLVLGLAGPHTGAADGTGSGKVYLTPIPGSTAPAPKPYTIQGGNDVEVEQIDYALATKIELNGMTGEALKMSATLLGRQVQRIAGFTGSATAERRRNPGVERSGVSRRDRRRLWHHRRQQADSWSQADDRGAVGAEVHNGRVAGL
jgi:hypothetical protein